MSAEGMQEDIPPIEWDENTTTEKPKRKTNGQHPPDDIDDEPLPAAFGDDALAVEWVKQHSENWRYVALWDTWHEWDGSRWAPIEGNKHFHLARLITREALLWPGADKLQARDLRRVNSASMAASILRVAKADPAIEANSDQWDTNPMLAGIPGGVIDLSVCKVIEAEREQYITKRLSVAPEKSPPTLWIEFLQRVTDGDKDLIDYLQRFAGYCLTGETREHALAFLYGTGANGKTTFVETLLHILQDYGLSTGMETLSEQHTTQHSTEIARLRGARLVASEETSSGARWNEARIKRLTGGGRIAARKMRQDDFEFTPAFKLLIAGNHKPALRADEAMRRRIHLVPFIVTIPEQDRDKLLGEKLKAEAPRILHWMLEGCAAWLDYGLSPGERIRDATEKYIQSNDILGAWIDDCCEITDASTFSDGRDLHKSFVDWCDQQGEKSWSRRGWSDAMIARGLDDARTKHARGFRGIKLRLTASPHQPDDYYDK